ncbi:hypothetical protein CYME_CMD165C [Cyanidioschyzon merolae strain 10D]|uniref:Uncharacterized protein n=1 Tax=Cyanidioschyzon merolae (strain NIES-3377 / 10D) TaxID=280699 RepID=M1V4B2_CYAM1|nr:hypothetical protein CYME_CMD165C [Cyanidioschyzon merolae strain 10D]BAM79225.1 hypothetical protein CYME_CMD165C [Cyanidioschyzon merolae strain 10D]|eukprot:XP_005535511.1 hypothetical protein CYME_CMD165C [Cyanidioschyzon merolae strain 10D]
MFISSLKPLSFSKDSSYAFLSSSKKLTAVETRQRSSAPYPSAGTAALSVFMRQRRDLREEKRLRNLEYARLHRKRVPRGPPGRRVNLSGNAAASAAERESVYSLYFTMMNAKQHSRPGKRDRQQQKQANDGAGASGLDEQ